MREFELMVLPLVFGSPSFRRSELLLLLGRLGFELLGERSLLPARGEGGTTVTLGKVLSESPPSSGAVVMNVGIRPRSGRELDLGSAVAFGEGIGGGRGGTGGMVVEGALLRVFGDMLSRGDSTERSERSRVCVGDAALTSLDKKLGAIFRLKTFTSSRRNSSKQPATFQS